MFIPNQSKAQYSQTNITNQPGTQTLYISDKHNLTFLFENLNRKYNIYNVTNTDNEYLLASHWQHNLKSFQSRVWQVTIG